MPGNTVKVYTQVDYAEVRSSTRERNKAISISNSIKFPNKLFAGKSLMGTQLTRLSYWIRSCHVSCQERIYQD